MGVSSSLRISKRRFQAPSSSPGAFSRSWGRPHPPPPSHAIFFIPGHCASLHHKHKNAPSPVAASPLPRVFVCACVCTRASLCCLDTPRRHNPPPQATLLPPSTCPPPPPRSFLLVAGQAGDVAGGRDGAGGGYQESWRASPATETAGASGKERTPVLARRGAPVSLGKGRLKLVFFSPLCLWFCALSLSPPLLTSSLKKGG